MRKLLGFAFLAALVYGSIVGISVFSMFANVRYEAQVYANVMQQRRERNTAAEREMLVMIQRKTGIVLQPIDVDAAFVDGGSIVRLRVPLPIQLPLLDRTLVRPIIVERRGQLGRSF